MVLICSRSSCLSILALSVSLLMGGCSRSVPVPSVEVIQPDAIQVDGSEWVKQPWDKKHDAQLAQYFRRAADVADNPALQVTPVCYSSGSRQRVYWLSPMENTCRWAMVEFKGSRGGEMVEGIGAPFDELSGVE